MKKTLTEQLNEALKSIEYYRGRYELLGEELRELKKKYDDRFSNQLMDSRDSERNIISANQQLQEIIRWHVNPETAKLSEKICIKCGNTVRSGFKCNNCGWML